MGAGNHTPLWIFTNVSLGDTIRLAPFVEPDHCFNVSGAVIYEYPGVGPVEVLVLEDLTQPGGVAWYEKSTGLLLNGTFYYDGGLKCFIFNLTATNAEFLALPNSYAPTLFAGQVSPLMGNTTTEFTFTALYADQDNNPPAYINLILNSTAYPMRKHDPADRNYVDGCIYQYTTTLPAGQYLYAFECGDWLTHVAMEGGVGPTVVELETPTEGIIRETLTYIIYPELLYGTSHLFQQLANGTRLFEPTERLTLTYDLATGILLHFLVEHLADPTTPTDESYIALEILLQETNLLMPYKFSFHDQILPIFVPADAALKSFFTSFEVESQYGVDMVISPATLTIYDDETGQVGINVTNTGNVPDTFHISLHNLTLGTGTFSHEGAPLMNETLTLEPKTSTFILLSIDPQQLGSEICIIQIQSLGSPMNQKSLILPFIILDDDALPPSITLQYIGDFTDASPGFIRVIASDPSGLAVDPSGDYEVLQTFEPQYFEFTAVDNDTDRPDDQLQQNASTTITIYDDDSAPPVVTDVIIIDDLHEITIRMTIWDASGVDAISLLIDGVSVAPLSQSHEGDIWTICLLNEWITEKGLHSTSITVWDADADRPADTLSSLVEGSFEITNEEMKQFVLWEMDQLIENVQISPDACWDNPADNRKVAMVNKIVELKDLTSCNDFGAAYDKLLHDIKPKLTGLKTGETEVPWGNGIFNNPWVTCPNQQEVFREACNQLLTHILLLIEGI
ncbi:MAG TPA: hypothetical protein VMV49_09385 [Candidatus Deferrimicrobium sp.]|nr:hypothetical protein [Candidatus Deferrimicrobium sp.]